MKGEGPAPEWYKHDKYKSVAEQAKGYSEAQKKITEMSGKLKGFTGAPEKYDLSLPEEIAAAGELITDDPMLAKFQETAAEIGMNQEAFSKILGMFAQYELAAQSIDLAAEKQAIGERADARLKGVDTWARAHLNSDQYENLKKVLGSRATPAQTFAALEAVLYASKQAAMPVDDTVQNTTMTLADVDAEWNALVTEGPHKGQRRVDVDPAYRKAVREKRRAVVGDGEHREVVG